MLILVIRQWKERTQQEISPARYFSCGGCGRKRVWPALSRSIDNREREERTAASGFKVSHARLQAWEVERLQEIIHYVPARQILLYYAKQTTCNNFIYLNGQKLLLCPFSANFALLCQANHSHAIILFIWMAKNYYYAHLVLIRRYIKLLWVWFCH